MDADLDVDTLLETWDQDGSEAARLIEKFIDTDEVTEFLPEGCGRAELRHRALEDGSRAAPALADQMDRRSVKASAK